MQQPDIIEQITTAVKGGHNVLITGQAGTGKSKLVRTLYKTLMDTGKRCELTATTGLAAVSLSGSTIHRFTGIMDGRNAVSTIIHRMSPQQTQSIRSTEVLFVDEISMMSYYMFCKMEAVLRRVRNSDRPFGGIQMVFAGDFLQLQPVPNPRYGDPGESLMKHQDMLSELLPHHFSLTVVHRQEEDDLIGVVNELSRGVVTKQTWKVLQQLSTQNFSSTKSTDVVKLHAHNVDVEISNHEALQSHDGVMYRYEAKDSGRKRSLISCTVPNILCLKVGAPVILRRTISHNLVNGLQGVVKSLNDVEAVISFENNIEVTMQPVHFHVYDVYGKIIATRHQLPITLAYALTVHKAQGLTIAKHLIIDAMNMDMPGQLAVAIGRGQKKERISIINLETCTPSKHPDFILEQYKGRSVDSQCCSSAKSPFQSTVNSPTTSTSVPSTSQTAPPTESVSDASSDEDIDSDDSDAEDVVTAFYSEYTELSHADLTNLFEHDEEGHLRDRVGSYRTTRLLKFVFNVREELGKIATKTLEKSDTKIANYNAFYAQVSHFMTSPCYEQLKVKLDRRSDQETSLVCFKIVKEVQQRIIVAGDVNPLPNRQVRNSAIGADNICNIGSWAVFQLMKELTKAIKSHPEKINDLKMVKCLVDRTASNRYTDEVEYVKGSMIRLNAQSQQFFIKLDELIRREETPEKLNAQRQDFYSSVLNNLLANTELNDIYSSLNIPQHLKLNMMKRYVRFSASRFRIELKREVVKETATRKSIAAATKKRKLASADIAPCLYCGKHCARASICCDKCDRWAHYRCAGFTGREPFLKDKDSTWMCKNCVA